MLLWTYMRRESGSRHIQDSYTYCDVHAQSVCEYIQYDIESINTGDVVVDI